MKSCSNGQMRGHQGSPTWLAAGLPCQYTCHVFVTGDPSWVVLRQVECRLCAAELASERLPLRGSPVFDFGGRRAWSCPDRVPLYKLVKRCPVQRSRAIAEWRQEIE